MKCVHDTLHVLGIILGGCVGMWMGAMSFLMVRLVRGVVWIRIVGRADWPSWSERYLDGLFILAMIAGAGAGAKFAHRYLQHHDDHSAEL
jgi:uncharacterized membrane protein YsdA (DUF1294 family)